MEALREIERRRSLADHYFENFRRYYKKPAQSLGVPLGRA
jgi:hypothetical protein